MKISLSWLQKHIEFKHPLEEITDKLTFAGLEVEHISEECAIPGGLQGIVVGEVLECNPIPETDKLKLTRININGEENLQIVCGAPNVAIGQKVAVAMVGSTIHPTKGEPFTIKKAKIRGTHSFGMLCAEDEIGLGESHDGIMVLDNTAIPGQALSEHLNIESQTVIEIGLTANRGDAASHRGVARDIAALQNNNLKSIKSEANLGSVNSPIKLSVQHPDCPRYMGVQIDNVKVEPSPKWIQNDLRAIGIEPINNIVDITNYVLHDLGQPIHAFDCAEIKGDIVTVRKANEGEKIATLDKVVRELKSTDLVIANEKEPMALAGVFGGLNSGITSSTSSVFIESAYFNPVTVRKTAKSFGLNTDASYRYERGTDPEMIPIALQMVSKMIIEYAGGEAKFAPVEHYPEKIEGFEVELNYKNIERILGIEIPKEEIANILSKLDIKITFSSETSLQLIIPAFKSDVTREIDVIEELIRIYGFDNIPLKTSSSIFQSSFQESSLYNKQKQAKSLLQGLGFTEIMNNSMVATKTENSVSMRNPLSAETAYMRTTLLDGLLKSIAHNLHRQNNQIKFFEIGTVFSKVNEDKIKEQQQLIIGCCGSVFSESWQFEKKPVDELYIKNIATQVLIELGIPSKKIPSLFQAEPCAVEGNQLKKYKIKEQVYYIIINFDKVYKNKAKAFKLKDVPKYPAVRRDLSLVIPKSTTYESIETITKKIGGDLLQEMNVFDIFEGKPLEDNQKSYSVSYLWQAEQKTLEDKDIDPKMNKLMELYEKELSAVIRK